MYFIIINMHRSLLRAHPMEDSYMPFKYYLFIYYNILEYDT